MILVSGYMNDTSGKFSQDDRLRDVGGGSTAHPFCIPPMLLLLFELLTIQGPYAIIILAPVEGPSSL